MLKTSRGKEQTERVLDLKSEDVVSGLSCIIS